MKKRNDRRGLFLLCLLVYAAVMLWLLFCRENHWSADIPYRQLLAQNANFQPVYTIGNYVHVVRFGKDGDLVRHCIINLGGNIFLFIPAGLLLPRVFPRLRRFFPFFFTCLLVMLAVETAQLLTLLGSFDVDDLILNLFGMILGYLFCIANSRK